MTDSPPKKKKQLTVLLVSDFFYPRVGGVEVHIFQLACSLLRLGIKVCVFTHHQKDRQGPKYMGNGIKAYYRPTVSIHDDTAIPIFFGAMKLFREVCIKEEVDIVHCHQATSVSSLECIIHARTLGLRTIITDHSLFGFGQLAEVSLNKVMRNIFIDLDQAISVSNIARDNFVIRTMFHPKNVHVIPNGIDFTKFAPNPNKNDNKDTITIVSVSRMHYRKGADLIIEVIPEICKKFPNVNWIIGGDGPKKELVQTMVDGMDLRDRVTLTGKLAHTQVREVMMKGDIFLNTSLTESFCIAIAEAASVGLYIVATDVGGVGEVLPKEIVKLVSCTKNGIVEGLIQAINQIQKFKNTKEDFNKNLSEAYNWDKVAHKTALVYERAMKCTDRSIITRLKKASGIGHLSSLNQLILIIIDYILLVVLAFFFPSYKYKKEPNFDYENYKTYLRKLK
ncbi:MAG: glycosyltransferase [archaeon]|nr:glycosyltransferase [archaeon]